MSAYVNQASEPPLALVAEIPDLAGSGFGIGDVIMGPSPAGGGGEVEYGRSVGVARAESGTEFIVFFFKGMCEFNAFDVNGTPVADDLFRVLIIDLFGTKSNFSWSTVSDVELAETKSQATAIADMMRMLAEEGESSPFKWEMDGPNRMLKLKGLCVSAPLGSSGEMTDDDWHLVHVRRKRGDKWRSIFADVDASKALRPCKTKKAFERQATYHGRRLGILPEGSESS